MPLPAFDEQGDLPVGVHQQRLTRYSPASATARHNANSSRPSSCASTNSSRATGKLLRFVIFGSYVTAKLTPNDIDIILVMRDDFEVAECDELT